MTKTQTRLPSPAALQEFGNWLNQWGDEEARHAVGAYREGYEDAIRDAYDRFDGICPDWSHPDWQHLTRKVGAAQ